MNRGQLSIHDFFFLSGRSLAVNFSVARGEIRVFSSFGKNSYQIVIIFFAVEFLRYPLGTTKLEPIFFSYSLGTTKLEPIFLATP